MENKSLSFWDEEYFLNDFLTFVRIDTTSNPDSLSKPTSVGQETLLSTLQFKLAPLADETSFPSAGFLLAKFFSQQPSVPTVLFISHVDTSPEASGVVSPIVHRNYNGSVITLKNGIQLDPQKDPFLASQIGKTVVTSDGTSLLGADNKAGVALMTTLAQIYSSQEDRKVNLWLLFTSDEEIGRGTENFPPELLEADFAYTVDGGGPAGVVEAECFHAGKAEITFLGQAAHLGDAYGKLVNSLYGAVSFATLTPFSDSAVFSKGSEGYLELLDLRGSIEKSVLVYFLRDFTRSGIERRIEILRNGVGLIEAKFPGIKGEFNFSWQYSNMKEFIEKHPEGLSRLVNAVNQCGMTCRFNSIRGGTDGARLSESGLPCPNIFTGGVNFHSCKEWLSVDSSMKALRLLFQLIQ